MRPYLANVDVEYNGISMVELNVEDAYKQYPDLAAFNKNGKMMAFGDHKAILGQVNGNGKKYICLIKWIMRNLKNLKE